MAIKPSPNPQNNMWDFIAFYLRVWRKKVGGSGSTAIEILSISEATLSRLEQGKRRLQGSEAAKLDKAWNTGGLFGLLVWYASIGHDPQWFAQYLELEKKAGIIRIFETQVVHGLLQAEGYARALIAAGSTANPEEVLRERLERQEVLRRRPAPHLTALISQSALEWPVGGPDVMRAQLQHLLDLSEQTNIIIRAIPRAWEVGAYPGLNGSFQLMTGEDFGEVAYTDSSGGGRLVSSPSDVMAFAVRYDQISAKALQEGLSRDLIRALMEAVQ